MVYRREVKGLAERQDGNDIGWRCGDVNTEAEMEYGRNLRILWRNGFALSNVFSIYSMNQKNMKLRGKVEFMAMVYLLINLLLPLSAGNN